MPQGHINIFGDIYPDQSTSASDWGIVSLRSVTDQINANNSADELVVHIHSRGGDVNEGFAIHDALFNSGKKITTSIEGMCASIATIIALSGSTRRITENSEFMIHNPWGFAGGDAEALQKYTDQVKAYEEKILSFYVAKTGGDKDQIAAMMKDETTMGSSTALEMKFVTEITENVQAFALLNTKTKIKMSKEKSTFQKAIDAFLGAVKNLAPTALTLSTIDGKSLEIDQEAEPLVVGSAVNLDSKPAEDGEYSLSTGNTITVSAGKISAIKANDPAAAKAAPTPDAKDIEILALKAANEKLIADQAASTAALQEATAILSKLKHLSSTEKPVERTAAATGAATPVEETRAQAAVRRAREAREAREASDKASKQTTA